MAQEVDGSNPFYHPIFFALIVKAKKITKTQVFTSQSRQDLLHIFTRRSRSSLKHRSDLLVKPLISFACENVSFRCRSIALVKLLPSGVRMVFLLKAHLAVLKI